MVSCLRYIMSMICDVCGKKPMFGKNVSHSHRKSPRRFNINLQKVTVKKNGESYTVKACTSCIKAGKVSAA